MVAYWEFYGDLDDFEENSAISMGYSLYESIDGLNSEEIKQALVRRRGKSASKYSIGANAGQFLLFQKAAVNDVVVVRNRRRTRHIRICRVTGPYQFDGNVQEPKHAHSYPVAWLTDRIPRDNLSGVLRARLKKRMLTIREFDDPADDIEALIASSPSASGRPPAREVTADTIAQVRDPDHHDEGPVTGRMTDLAMAHHIRSRRTSEHGQLVQAFASKMPDGLMYEGVFDLAATLPPGVVLAEMKTLDGTHDDEVRQVRHAVGQLLYYEKLSLPDDFAGGPVAKVAVFDKRPSSAHVGWMEDLCIAVAWRERNEFVATPKSKGLVGLEFLHAAEEG